MIHYLIFTYNTPVAIFWHSFHGRTLHHLCDYPKFKFLLCIFRLNVKRRHTITIHILFIIYACHSTKFE